MGLLGGANSIINTIEPEYSDNQCERLGGAGGAIIQVKTLN